MESISSQIRVRDSAMELVNQMTTWVVVGAVAILGALTFVAGWTVPGKAASTDSGTAQNTPGSDQSTNPSSGSFFHHHHDDGSPSNISSTTGPPMVVSGGSSR
jgi:hypothetical protein